MILTLVAWSLFLILYYTKTLNYSYRNIKSVTLFKTILMIFVVALLGFDNGIDPIYQYSILATFFLVNFTKINLENHVILMFPVFAIVFGHLEDDYSKFLPYCYLLIFLQGVRRQDFPTILLGLLGTILGFYTSYFRVDLAEIFLPLFFIGNFVNYLTLSKKSNDISYLMVMGAFFIAPQLRGQLLLVLSCLSVLTTMFILMVRKNIEFKVMWLVMLTMTFVKSENIYLTSMVIFYIFTLSIVILNTLFVELKNIEVEKGKLLLSYSQIFYILLASIMVIGVYGTPLAWAYEKIYTSPLAYISIGLGYLILLLKQIFQVDKLVQKIEIKYFELSSWILLASFLLYATASTYVAINPFSVIFLILTMGTVYIENKKIDLFKRIAKVFHTVEWDTPRRVYKSNKIRFANTRAMPKTDHNSKLFKIPDFSYSITVCLIFLLWFTYLIGVLK
jgi:hypothetical protein